MMDVSKSTRKMSLSTHFMADKMKSLCFLKNIESNLQEEVNFLPLVATGSWDEEVNHITLQIPILPSKEETSILQEFGREEKNKSCELTEMVEVVHQGDVNALKFMSCTSSQTHGGDFLLSASSNGSLYCYRLKDLVGGSPTTICPLETFSIPQWENLFNSSVTCLDVNPLGATVVTASESGDIAWLKLNETLTIERIANTECSHLAINDLKILATDNIIATVGAAPSNQLKIWDIAHNQLFPIAAVSDPHPHSVLTTIETHPTRPELLITGSNDGHVCFWDHRKLTRGPFRIETNYHLGAIHSLKIHAEAPRFLYSCAEDGNVLCWDFHHNRSTSETAVEYEKRPTSLEKKASHLQVYPLTSSFLPWNCMDLDVKSDTIISGSDTHELVIIQNASKMTQQQPIHRIP